MSDQEQTIDHLRSVIKTLQTKLNYRTLLLAEIIPHVEAWASGEEDPRDHSANYICFEIQGRYAPLIEQFKDEYAKENGVGSSDKTELRG